MAEFSSNAKGNLGVTLGAIGTGLGILAGGGTLLGGTGLSNHASNYITKSEFEMGQELAKKDSQIALLQSEQNTEIKIADVYERIMTRVNSDAREQATWNANQSVANAQMSAAIATNTNSIAILSNTLGNLTKTVIPNSNVCPGWGSVQVEPVSINGCGCTGTTSLY